MLVLCVIAGYFDVASKCKIAVCCYCPHTCRRLFTSSMPLTPCLVLPGGQRLPLLLLWLLNTLALQEMPCQEQYSGGCVPATAAPLSVPMYWLQAAVLLTITLMPPLLNTSCHPRLFSQPYVSSAVLLVLVLLLLSLVGTSAPRVAPKKCSAAHVAT